MIFQVDSAEYDAENSRLLLRLVPSEYKVLQNAGLIIPGVNTKGDRDKFIAVMGGAVIEEVEQSQSVKDWVDEWRMLFPEGKNPNTYRAYRGDKQACREKMQKFVSKYKYGKDTIMKATKAALEQFSRTNYLYFPQADYFITKDNQSLLSQYCEAIEEGDNNDFTPTTNRTYL